MTATEFSFDEGSDVGPGAFAVRSSLDGFAAESAQWDDSLAR